MLNFTITLGFFLSDSLFSKLDHPYVTQSGKSEGQSVLGCVSPKFAATDAELCGVQVYMFTVSGWMFTSVTSSRLLLPVVRLNVYTCNFFLPWSLLMMSPPCSHIHTWR